ncbi:MAG: hydantoinase/oxoprolinase family protein [Thaumarchaeota archaeon]|nr:hydantoinase/oxoprolinase family protein [Nitrososphaerota archaeon]
MLAIGIDVGGTFTDLVVHDPQKNETQVVKVPTSSKNPAEAILAALAQFRERASEIVLISHASTTATNALLTHTGLAKTALITNRGFKDVLEIARQRRPELYDLYTNRPVQIVERKDRFTVRCRILADGRELEALSVSDVKRAAKTIVSLGFESVAIAFLNSYVNPKHEKQAEKILKQMKFKGHIDLSSDVNKEYREYERMSTTVVNAALSPLISTYLTNLKTMLRREGFEAPVYVMNSDGGMSTISFASSYPITVIESGPAAGVLASKHLARFLDLPRVITFDMGGTTAKAGTVLNGMPDISYEFEAAGRTHSGRSIKGSGYAVRTPFIDLAEVSSGGGTIAWVDEGGAIRVGPESAGSEPGPAAYGKGGENPTVTDANVVLGRINPNYLLSGKMPIHNNLSRNAMRKIADRINTSIIKVAEGIIRLVNDNMSKAISIVSVERGRDPREFSLMAFGGAGPLHCCHLADELEINHIVVPRHAGLFSAYGLLTADLSRTFSIPVLSTTASVEPFFAELTKVADGTLEEEGFGKYTGQKYVDLRYKGQSFELTLPYEESADIKLAFSKRHKEIYGYSSDDEVEIVNAKIRAIVPTATIKSYRARPDGSGEQVAGSNVTRDVWFENEFSTVPIYTREEMKIGSYGKGPCVIEEYDSTLVVNSGWSWKVEDYGTELIKS